MALKRKAPKASSSQHRKKKTLEKHICQISDGEEQMSEDKPSILSQRVDSVRRSTRRRRVVQQGQDDSDRIAGKRNARKAPSSKNRKRKTPKKQISEEEEEESDKEEPSELSDDDEEEEPEMEVEAGEKKHGRRFTKRRVVEEGKEVSHFVPSSEIGDDEACRRWPHRYLNKRKGKGVARSESGDEKIQAISHFRTAKVDDHVFNLGDSAYALPAEGEDNYICRIVEMFMGADETPYITAQWFYRAKDTVIEDRSEFIDDDNRRVFLSTIKDDNHLDCLLGKIKIVELPLNADSDTKMTLLSDADYYYNMMYYVPFSTFLNPQHDKDGNESDVTLVKKVDEMKLLDLFSGCGAMSTGLCLGSNMSGVHLVTKWAVDMNVHACKSLELNHPETQVRNERAEDFLALLKEWEKLCIRFSLMGSGEFQQHHDAITENEIDEEESVEGQLDDHEVYEVEKIVSICYGDPNKTKTSGLHFKIRWKGYEEDDDTWEPIDGLGDCQDKIKDFVINGYKSQILPLPGSADVICGGPPCQGISGFNRFRDKDKPLEDPRNYQLVVFMDIVNYLRPRFVLMENVVDIVKFAHGYLGRYALARLVNMNYQARMGMMVAGAYGLPQFRMRMFMWGAYHAEKLPQYPLPTHNVVVKGTPTEFESNSVAFDEGHGVDLKEELFLKDAISDLPPVDNYETRDEMPYGMEPQTNFQRFVRSRKEEMPGYLVLGSKPLEPVLFDHRPLQLNEDDYQRVCQIPFIKGACFRDLEGVIVQIDTNKVKFDPDVERVYLPSGKPLVPDYAMSFQRGTSTKPFGRLWWDETVPTVVTRAQPHNRKIMHPVQNRVLTVRENARLQGFPDYYQLCGPIKQRYIQVGNAVAVPVARALGYSLGLAAKGGSSCVEHVFTLPKEFPNIPAEN